MISMRGLRWLVMAAVLASCPAPASTTRPSNPWVPALAVKYKEMGWQVGHFESRIAGGEVGYLLFLPPGYRASQTRRYPVLYWLHGLSSSPAAASQISSFLAADLRAGRGPEMIIVSCVDPTRRSMWTDSKDGRYRVESVIVEELIPYIDSHYRTIPTRQGRGVEGYSMGGYGAAYLGFKYPDLFGSVSMLGAALYHPADLRDRRRRIFADVFGGDLAYARAQSPWQIVSRNAARIRGRTRIRLYVGEKDRFRQTDENFHKLLGELGIQHEFGVVPHSAHSAREFFADFPGDFLAFDRMAFAPAERQAQFKTTAALQHKASLAPKRAVHASQSPLSRPGLTLRLR